MTKTPKRASLSLRPGFHAYRQEPPWDQDDIETVVRVEVDRWLRRFVIGLNLCPFAKSPYNRQRVQVLISRARDEATLLADLEAGLRGLQACSEEEVETAILVHPWVLNDFYDYNDFLDHAEALLERLDLDGELQVASFHPRYQFADTTPRDVSNATNQSPYPMLHLLRESSLDRAVASGMDADAIVEHNIQCLQDLGWAGVERLRHEPDSVSESENQDGST